MFQRMPFPTNSPIATRLIFEHWSWNKQQRLLWISDLPSSLLRHLVCEGGWRMMDRRSEICLKAWHIHKTTTFWQWGRRMRKSIPTKYVRWVILITLLCVYLSHLSLFTCFSIIEVALRYPNQSELSKSLIWIINTILNNHNSFWALALLPHDFFTTTDGDHYLFSWI